jgi:hypothetical protein
MREAKMTLEDPKADKPEKTGEMPSKYELCWSQFNDKGEIEEKDKSFDSLEKFIEFKEELELDPNFLQIHRKVIPTFMDELPKAKSEEMEKVKIKESNKRKSTMRSLKETKLRKLIRMMVLKEMKMESAMTPEKKKLSAKLKSMNWPELKKYLKQDGYEEFITGDQDSTVDDLIKSVSIDDLKALAGD